MRLQQIEEAVALGEVTAAGAIEEKRSCAKSGEGIATTSSYSASQRANQAS